MRSYHLPELVWAAVLTLAWLAVAWAGRKVWEAWQLRTKRAKGEIVIFNPAAQGKGPWEPRGNKHVPGGSGRSSPLTGVRSISLAEEGR